LTLQDIAKTYSVLLSQNKLKNINVLNGTTWPLYIPLLGKYYFEMTIYTNIGNAIGGTGYASFVGNGGEFGSIGSTGAIYHYSSASGMITYKNMILKSIYKYGFALDFINGTISVYESGVLIYIINVANYGIMSSIISYVMISNYWGGTTTVATGEFRTRAKEFLYPIPDGYISLYDLLVGSECYKDKENKLYGIK